jgi:hypothetical protein
MGISKTSRNQRVTTPTHPVSSRYSRSSSQLFDRYRSNFKNSSQTGLSNRSLNSHQFEIKPNRLNLQVPIVPITSPSSLSVQTNSRRIKQLT